MLTGRAKTLIILAFLGMVLLTGRARLALDDIVAPFRDDFREMMYLPRGDSLKIIACGFDAPLADALFIKGMIYYAEAINSSMDRSVRVSYTYELFDVITDLSPRFTRAYQIGALFLTSSSLPKSNFDGVRLLEKGVDTFARAEKEGHSIKPDARWLFHTLIANTFEVNIQVNRRMAGDLLGAAEARNRAGQEFTKAAFSPGAPLYVINAAEGYTISSAGSADVEAMDRAVLSIWQNLYQHAVDRGDQDVLPDIEARIDELQTRIDNIATTREIETELGAAGKEYLNRHGRAPVGAADLVRDNLIPAVPPGPLAAGGLQEQWLALPDGQFRSRILANMETTNHIELLFSAMLTYMRSAKSLPERPQALVDAGLVNAIPEPPLAALGQVYEYDAKRGYFYSILPSGPELPPDRR